MAAADPRYDRRECIKKVIEDIRTGGYVYDLNAGTIKIPPSEEDPPKKKAPAQREPRAKGKGLFQPRDDLSGEPPPQPSVWRSKPGELPPPGALMNCQAAAVLAKHVAAHRLHKGPEKARDKEAVTAELQIVTVGPANDFFVPSKRLAFRTREPAVTGEVTGWEFDNHYRLRDTTTDEVYDPVFGTGPDDNPVGYAADKPKTRKRFILFGRSVVKCQQGTSSYGGGKYQVTRMGATHEGKIRAATPATGPVADKDYVYRERGKPPPEETQ